MGLKTIVLADDHQMVREGLRALLDAEPDCQVVGEAADGLATLELVERLTPDIVVVDVLMPGMNGLEAARQITQRSPRTQIVILSMHANEAYVSEALRAGAEAYVLKDASSEELVRAVRQVSAGRRYLSPPLSERAVEAYLSKATESEFDLYDTLTPREREVLQLVAEGYTSPEIAQRFSISPRTVETHRANMMRKLELSTQADVIRYALRRGVISVQ
jgi:DNA-binding NarL/FixJ family response regulator